MNVFVGAFGEAVLGLRDGGFIIGRWWDAQVALGGACPLDCSRIVAVMLDTASHRDHDDDDDLR